MAMTGRTARGGPAASLWRRIVEVGLVRQWNGTGSPGKRKADCSQAASRAIHGFVAPPNKRVFNRAHGWSRPLCRRGDKLRRHECACVTGRLAKGLSSALLAPYLSGSVKQVSRAGGVQLERSLRARRPGKQAPSYTATSTPSDTSPDSPFTVVAFGRLTTLSAASARLESPQVDRLWS
ncbi:hypothetical protein BS50DRAFT_353295 [Corynespora cassiicola Philippines]|uniref:Uncharacterized protein n=1 Tax=Corynespora cassiicola Philippines TaxID=1448308 RepID=A0A2T2NRE6_CORCC|nr:hypothetical protein BS50DRAFT_353295 [Corynespora cassiicola Philippines]